MWGHISLLGKLFLKKINLKSLWQNIPFSENCVTSWWNVLPFEDPWKTFSFSAATSPKGSKLDIRLALQNRAEPNLVSQTPQNKKPREEQKKHSPFLTLFVFFFFSHLFLSGFSFSFKIIFKTIFKLWFKSI